MIAADESRAKLALSLRAGGVTDADVLRVVEMTPRDLFVPGTFAERAWEDMALPIECGQTISQPLTVARMTEALKLNDRCKVFEVGTGSGYQTTILAQLSRRVYTMERYKALLREAEARFKHLGLLNITSRHGDGGLGWVEQAPFDRIIVTCACPTEPGELLDQLKDGGVCVAPVGPGSGQELMVYERTGARVSERSLGATSFVPLLSGPAPTV